MSWQITFMNGAEEITPPEVERMTLGGGPQFEQPAVLYGQTDPRYGPRDTIVTYPLCNVMKWEKIR